MRYPWILFDVDGTLFDYDSAEDAALGTVLSSAGLEPGPDTLAAYRRINGALWSRFEEGGVTAEEIKWLRFEQLLDEIGSPADARELAASYLEALAGQTELLPGAEELLDGLAGRAELALVTNGLASVQRPRLAASAIGHHFATIVISEEIGVAKPDPRIFAAALGAMGEPARDEVLMVGDNLKADIGGANGFGLATCWYNQNGLADRDGVEPTYEIHRLEELERHLEA